MMKLPKHLALHEFASRPALAGSLANEIAHQLDRAIQIRGRAVMAVSGGKTPAALFKGLSRAELNWTHVTVTLVDERWVGPENARSNERLVKETLLTGRAAFAQFVPLYLEGSSAEEAESTIGAAISRLPKPFDVVVLGMGLDGHTASYFPNAEGLEKATALATGVPVTAIRAEGVSDARMTLTLPQLVQSRFLALHIEGEEKLQVLKEALEDGDADRMPIRHILRKRNTETNIFWAP